MAAVRSGHRKSHSTSALSSILGTKDGASTSVSSSSGSSSGSSALSSAAAARRKLRASQHPSLGIVEEKDSALLDRSASRRDLNSTVTSANHNLRDVGSQPDSSTSTTHYTAAKMSELPGLTRSRSVMRLPTAERDQPVRKSSTAVQSTRSDAEGTDTFVYESDYARMSPSGLGGDHDELASRLQEALERSRKSIDASKEKAGLHRAKSRKSGARERNEEDVKVWMRELMSLRSSDRRRREALRGLERTVFASCQRPTTSTSENVIDVLKLLDLRVYDALINLMARHAQTLSRRGQSLVAGDEMAAHLVPEIACIVGMLQGLSLMSRSCKEVLGEPWVMEIIIDLLLLLRHQPALDALAPSEASQSVPVDHSILELLCCVLVDSTANMRTFEQLGGLEAVTRVAKGSTVPREVQMKCIEFIYFYLQPEATMSKRVVSSSSTSSSSSTDSHPYPGTPFTPIFTSDSDGRMTPSIVSGSKFQDLDIPFVPQTPSNPARHALGYPTPNHSRKISASHQGVPSLAPITGSPVIMSPGGSTDKPRDSSQHGHGERPVSQNSRPISRNSVASSSSKDERRWSAVEMGVSNQGLGLGMTKSASVVNLSDRRNGARSSPADPFIAHASPPSGDSRSSSGSSTAVPPNLSMGSNTPTSTHFSAPVNHGSSGLVRSSTQPNFTSDVNASLINASNVTARRPSIKRPQKSSTPSAVSSPRRAEISREPVSGAQALPRPPKIRHSRTQSQLIGTDRISMPPPTSIPPRKSMEVEVDRRSSQTSLTLTPDPAQPLRSPGLLSATTVDVRPLSPGSNSTISGRSTPTPTSTPVLEVRPTPAKKSFPSGMTKGLPPSMSTPNLSDLARQAHPRHSGTTTPGQVSSDRTSTSTPGGANLSGTSSTPGAGGANLSVSSMGGSSANTSLSSTGRSPSINGSSMPLGAVRRVPSISEKRARPDRRELGSGFSGQQGVKSVEEKKAMLGARMGNVDALVESVEKVGFFASRPERK
ncbi:cell division control protein 14, SIN component-domain-containing protein [Kockovaella imperatae]|uniref:Cell division control protein 14, SIN component-domain-containing protein n=1 Tax=Kockovaella imperatae TaxID=4999 RepID=A0A1Y1UHM7_9TREE|nr:cell division control protein 14, SIN component-domain-containing protein [Kockovaella imperatae]ORX37561.1 cell division control protein 14, SIN component-domain-containing protein [Kockovaella imperatae]